MPPAAALTFEKDFGWGVVSYTALALYIRSAYGLLYFQVSLSVCSE